MAVQLRLIAFTLIAFLWMFSIRQDVEASRAAQTKHLEASDLHPRSALDYERLAQRTLKAARENPSQELLDSVYEYQYNYERLDAQMNLSELIRTAVLSKSVTSDYLDLHIHRYDDLNDLLASGGADANQELCLSQLAELVQRARQLEYDKLNTSDINMFQLLDTFGRPAAGALGGADFFWPGIYRECLRFDINFKYPTTLTSDLRTSATRYCLTSLRLNDWPRDELHENAGLIKSAVCLPKACDSLNHKNKFELIRQLQETQGRRMDKGNFRITDLYCLPDEQSSLRQFWRSPASLLTFTLLVGWFCLQVFATYWLKKHQSATHKSRQISETKLKLFKCLSISDNLTQLCDISTTSSDCDAAKSRSSPKVNQGHGERGSDETRGLVHEGRIVDLSSLDGIKVVVMCYVIVGHVLMCVLMSTNNIREQADNRSLSFTVANVLPVYAVNTFFTISGVLIAYQLFKRQQLASLTRSPTNWLAFIMYRYMRIMPMYALVVVYLKTAAKYTSAGPFWDYATSSMGQRKTCEQESFLWTLLFGANFKSPLDHCIASGWYLANDFQFIIITPILLTILHKSPTIGKRVLVGGIFAGYLSFVWSILSLPAEEDLRPILKHMPHGFKRYTSLLSHSYTQPQNRIPAYLFGLLVGYLLYEFEQKQLKYLEFRAKQGLLREKTDGDEEPPAPADWPASLKRYGFAICAIFITISLGNSIAGSIMPYDRVLARYMVAINTPLFHILFSAAAGIYILLTSTGLGSTPINWILAHPLWRPLARLSLCTVVCNTEVILFVIQSSTHSFFIDSANHFGLDLFCITLVYMVSAVIYVLFETPIRRAIDLLVSSTTSRMANNRREE